MYVWEIGQIIGNFLFQIYHFVCVCVSCTLNLISLAVPNNVIHTFYLTQVIISLILLIIINVYLLWCLAGGIP